MSDINEHVRDTFEWAMERVEAHPVAGYTNPVRRMEVAQEVTRLVIELEALLVEAEARTSE